MRWNSSAVYAAEVDYKSAPGQHPHVSLLDISSSGWRMLMRKMDRGLTPLPHSLFKFPCACGQVSGRISGSKSSFLIKRHARATQQWAARKQSPGANKLRPSRTCSRTHRQKSSRVVHFRRSGSSLGSDFPTLKMEERPLKSLTCLDLLLRSS